MAKNTVALAEKISPTSSKKWKKVSKEHVIQAVQSYLLTMKLMDWNESVTNVTPVYNDKNSFNVEFTKENA